MEAQTVPVIGEYTPVKEYRKDAYGVLYEAVNPENKARALIRVINPEISNSENFIVRFELLKRLLTEIEHPNLVQILALEENHSLFSIIKSWPNKSADRPLLTLQEFDPRETPNRHRAYEQLFQGLTEAVKALSEVSDSFHKAGIFPDTLSPTQIFIDFEGGLVGGSPRVMPKLDGFCESFLFYGDQATPSLNYRMANAAFAASEHENLDVSQSVSLYSEDHLYAPKSRCKDTHGEADVMYAIGALMHHVIGHTQPKGLYPSLTDLDPTLDSNWNEISSLCLNAHNQAASLSELSARLQSLQQVRTQLSPQEKRLRSVEIPQGMSLILFDDKVELGAADGPEVEQPRFRAKLRPFFIDIYPISNAEFQQFLKNHIRSTYAPSDEHPATLVSWNLATAYCRWRSEQEGLPPDTYRLPTEYEWEAAARGANGEQYPWGKEPNPHRLHCDLPKEHGALPIGTLPPGRFGLHDMLGNTWEWTSSIFKPHPFSKHYTKEYEASLYVVKGGCWFTPLTGCRASLRAAFAANESRGNVGFRCVRMVDLD